MNSDSAVVELKHYPVNDKEDVIAKTDVTLDNQITNDGNGALRINASQSMTVRLYETGEIDIENARLTYQAKVRSENVEGKAYLEMWCHFAGKGEYFARDFSTPVNGTVDWTTEEVHFPLQEGENPDNLKLNLVIEGKGIIWIDDIRLIKGPLN